jgi:prepilin-type N-terminal cleavage/methylation domain-containing protein
MKKSFTLVEVLVVLSIIGILSLMTFSGIRSSQSNLSVLRSGFALVSELRKAQEWALGQKDGKTNYGIYVRNGSSPNNPGEIILFSDENRDRRYQPREKKEDFILELKGLEKGVFVKSTTPYSPLNIVFEAPQPTIYFNNSISSPESEIILSNGSFDVKVKVNRAGLIWLQAQ